MNPLNLLEIIQSLIYGPIITTRADLKSREPESLEQC